MDNKAASSSFGLIEGRAIYSIEEWQEQVEQYIGNCITDISTDKENLLLFPNGDVVEWSLRNGNEHTGTIVAAYIKDNRGEQ